MKKKLLTMLLTSAMILGCFAGCGKTETKQTEESKKSSIAQQSSEEVQTSETKEEPKEPVTIEVGGWPAETSTKERERMDKVREDFMAKNPDIVIVPKEWQYDVKAYLPQATSGQVPTLYTVYFTELDRVINAGFAKDITKSLEDEGWLELLSEETKDLVSRDGKYYFLPTKVYCMGLQINKNVFKAAGLVNKDGSVMIPETYDEVIEFSKIIVEKTDAYGFMLPTMGASGGWRFINLAWSFGTNFMEQVDGKWKATFNSPEFEAALQYLKDMKFKHGLMPEDNILIGGGDIQQWFAADQVGMCIDEPLSGAVITKYAFDKDDLVYASMPEGPGGRYVQMGGNVQVIDRNATEEQVEACLRWMEYTGKGPFLTDDVKANIDSAYDVDNENGLIVGIKPLSGYNEDAEVVKYRHEVINKKLNVNPKNFEHFGLNKAILRPEEPVNCAELYQVLSSCMQEVLSSEDSDIAKIIEKAASDFQINSLDNSNY